MGLSVRACVRAYVPQGGVHVAGWHAPALTNRRTSELLLLLLGGRARMVAIGWSTDAAWSTTPVAMSQSTTQLSAATPADTSMEEEAGRPPAVPAAAAAAGGGGRNSMHATPWSW
jgi:hypothetical protein